MSRASVTCVVLVSKRLFCACAPFACLLTCSLLLLLQKLNERLADEIDDVETRLARLEEEQGKA